MWKWKEPEICTNPAINDYGEPTMEGAPSEEVMKKRLRLFLASYKKPNPIKDSV